MTVDDLIKALRDAKKADPSFGKRKVYAGSHNLISVNFLEKSPAGAIILREDKS